MDRDEETDIAPTGAEHLPSGTDSGSPARFSVVIYADGSAAVDGEPVTPEQGKSLDDAILDTLHAHARDRGTPVTAAISDPSADYVAVIEVAPDGSSKLLDQLSVVTPAAPTAEPPAKAARNDTTARRPAGPPDDEDDSPEDDGPGDDDPEGDGRPDDDIPDALYGSPARPSPGPRISRMAPARVLGRGTGPRQSDDAYAPPGLMNRPLVVGPVALVVAALVITPLVVLGSGGSENGNDQDHTARTGDQISAPAPTASVSPRFRVSSSPSTSPSGKSSNAAKDKDPKKEKGAKKEKGTETAGSAQRPGTVITMTPPRSTATVTKNAKPAKPRKDTAADAVKRLANNDPGGRHICYRAYVSKEGWQKPVCDGTMAGTTGRGRTIKALNIAVYGVKGSAANAFLHVAKSEDGKGRWSPSWTAIVADGKDNYVGRASGNAPDLLGFAINVGSGRVCHSARLRGGGWSSRICADKRPSYLFGGSLDNDARLEAVKLTV